MSNQNEFPTLTKPNRTAPYISEVCIEEVRKDHRGFAVGSGTPLTNTQLAKIHMRLKKEGVMGSTEQMPVNAYTISDIIDALTHRKE